MAVEEEVALVVVSLVFVLSLASCDGDDDADDVESWSLSSIWLLVALVPDVLPYLLSLPSSSLLLTLLPLLLLLLVPLLALLLFCFVVFFAGDFLISLLPLVPLVSLPTPPSEFFVRASSNRCAAGKGPSAPELKILTGKIEAPKVVRAA